MGDLATVVVNAAGRGTRLGQNRPKCLVPFLGQPLIHWQLQTVPRIAKLIVSVGFHADDVMREVLARRPDAEFVHNDRYADTGTASSLCLAAQKCAGPVLSLDGDMLVHPDDLLRLLSAPPTCIGLSPVQSNAPVLVEVERTSVNEQELACRFLYQTQPAYPAACFEWTGLVVFDPSRLSLDAEGHVFQMISPLLPCLTLHVRCCEVDFPDELPQMERWIASLVAEGSLHG